MACEHILYESSEGVATLTPNRPEHLDTFNVAMHLDVREALALAMDDAGVLTGAGRRFCAGQDLNDRAAAPGEARPDLGESLDKYYMPLVLSLRALPKPAIAAVNGVAAGAALHRRIG